MDRAGWKTPARARAQRSHADGRGRRQVGSGCGPL